MNLQVSITAVTTLFFKPWSLQIKANFFFRKERAIALASSKIEEGTQGSKKHLRVSN